MKPCIPENCKFRLVRFGRKNILNYLCRYKRSNQQKLMKKLVISFILIMVCSLLGTPLSAQTTRQNLPGAIYKVTPQRMERYRNNALTVLQNFYSTLPECEDLEVKENFIANLMEPGTILKVDFYTRSNKNEFLSPDRFIMEFMKEYGQYIESGDGLEMELSGVSYDENLVHPEGDEHAVLLQINYQLAIRHQGKTLKTGNSRAICYFPSRTDYRTCKVRQIEPTTHTANTTSPTVPTTVVEVPKPEKAPETVSLSGINTGQASLTCITPHPALTATLNEYMHSTSRTFEVDFTLQNKTAHPISIRGYSNIYKPFKVKAQDSTGKTYETTLYIDNKVAMDQLVLRSAEKVNCRIIVSEIPMNKIKSLFIEWPIHCDALGIDITQAQPISIFFETF